MNKVRAITFASLKVGTIDFHVGYGFGQNNGGRLIRINYDLVPEDCLMPNTYVWVWLDSYEVTQIKKMSLEEAFENEKTIIDS